MSTLPVDQRASSQAVSQMSLRNTQQSATPETSPTEQRAHQIINCAEIKARYRRERCEIKIGFLQRKADNKIERIRNKTLKKTQKLQCKTQHKVARILAKASTLAMRDDRHTPCQINESASREYARHDSQQVTTSVTIQKPKKTKKPRLDVHGRVKPAMRGWLHLIAAPLSLAAGIVLICLAPTTALRWACAAFMTSSLILFGNSAAYHLGNWSPRITDILRRIDHVNIFLLIAGTYTPPAFALSDYWRNIILIGIWSCTAIAMIIHVCWINAPRWLVAAVYVIFGIASVAFIGLFWIAPAAGPTVVILIASGGLCYIIGAICYACRWPDLWPKIFGFHEVFHTLTIAGYSCHVVAIYMIIVHMMLMA